MNLMKFIQVLHGSTPQGLYPMQLSLLPHTHTRRALFSMQNLLLKVLLTRSPILSGRSKMRQTLEPPSIQ